MATFPNTLPVTLVPRSSWLARAFNGFKSLRPLFFFYQSALDPHNILLLRYSPLRRSLDADLLEISRSDTTSPGMTSLSPLFLVGLLGVLLVLCLLAHAFLKLRSVWAA